MDDLKKSRVGLEEERLSVKEHCDEIEATIQVKRNELQVIDENIQKKNDKIDEKQVKLHHAISHYQTHLFVCSYF